MATDPQFRIVHRAPVGHSETRDRPSVAPDLVLVVDDEPEIRMQVSGWLEAAGYRVRTATHAEEAVRDLREPMPAIVISDVALPGFDGRSQLLAAVTRAIQSQRVRNLLDG